ncbi:MAG TPA: response regulator [Longimicrobiaceae bacterium]|nr:response regulator [Longimicrobiaceae bacterium]
MDRKTILVVDDSESICSALTCVLELAGHTPLTAGDGAEGVRKARQHRPDVILLDIMMPVLDGWGAIRELKASPETATIPVLALTALRLSQAEVDGAGFAGYLSKPIPSHRLLEEIERACTPAR